MPELWGSAFPTRLLLMSHDIIKISSPCYTFKIKWPFPIALSLLICRIVASCEVFLLEPFLWWESPALPSSACLCELCRVCRAMGSSVPCCCWVCLTVCFPRTTTLRLYLWLLMLCVSLPPLHDMHCLNLGTVTVMWFRTRSVFSFK